MLSYSSSSSVECSKKKEIFTTRMLLLILVAYVKAKKHFFCINLLADKKITISFFYTTLTYFIITALLQDNHNLFSINGHTMEVAHYSLLSIKRRELIFLIMTKWCISILQSSFILILIIMMPMTTTCPYYWLQMTHHFMVLFVSFFSKLWAAT